MKKQLCISALAALFAHGSIAQTADLDQSPVTVIQQSVSQTRMHAPAQVSSTCNAATMCPQITTNTGNVRGYYFIAPVSFVLCGLLVPTDASTGPQSIEVLKFSGMTPPAYPSVTNTFTSLFYVASDTGTVTPVSCNLLINAGDTIGIYGARSTSTICSYAMASCQISILGNNVTLTRSGMQFPLYNQQMHDVWSEAASDISRVIMYVDAAPSSVNELSSQQVSVSPNPSSGVFTINAGKNAFVAGDKIEVYNALGAKVFASAGIPSKVDISAQPKGIYFMNITLQGHTATKRIVIAD